MNIESLEINLLKASEIKDGDIIVIKVNEDEKSKLNKEIVQSLYMEIKKIINKENISVYFFPKNIDINIVKEHIKNVESEKNKIEKVIE